MSNDPSRPLKLTTTSRGYIGSHPSAGCHCTRCGVEYETPSRPACECAGDPPVDKDGLDYEAYLDRVRRLRWDR